MLHSHLNSVDKNSDGDYLVCARLTDAVYLVSGQSGDIIWTLGSENSDFIQDFTFSRQHDARFISHNATHTVISLLNNASDEDGEQEETSSAMYILLDTALRPMLATVIAQYYRPDGDLTRLRGNVQTLPGGNVFVGWSQQGYHSEFAANGTLAMEARFVGDRFSSYRTYKSTFVGRPVEPPTLMAFLYGPEIRSMNTVIYISWNGATDVASYRFFAKSDENKASVSIGTVEKTGFETMFIANGYMDWVSAEALDASGNVLGLSEVQRTILPETWLTNGFQDPQLVPEDPLNDRGASGRQNQTITYAFTKEWYSPDWSLRILALAGAVAVVIFFAGLAVTAVVFVKRLREIPLLRRYKKVPDEEGDDDDDDDEEYTEMHNLRRD